MLNRIRRRRRLLQTTVMNLVSRRRRILSICIQRNDVVQPIRSCRRLLRNSEWWDTVWNNCLWYGYHQRENTGSRLFTEVKPCWTGLISGWVTISIKYPVLYSLGSQAGVVDINHAIHLYYYNVVCGLSFSRSQPDFEGFLRALRFPPFTKLTPC